MATALTHARTKERDRRSSRTLAVFLTLMSVGILLRIAFLDRQGLWFDEGVGLIFSSCPTVSDCLAAMLDTRTSERFQFVYPLLLHGWRQLFGSSEIALRSLSVLCGVAALPLIWMTALRCFGRAHAGWTMAFMALSAFSIFHAQEARPYTFFLLIAAAQIWLFMLAREGSRPARLGLFLVTAFASWAGIFPLLFSVALALADLADRPLRFAHFKSWFVWWLPAGLLCLPAVAYYAAAALETLPSEVGVPKSNTPALNLAFVIYGHLVGQTYGPPVEGLRGADRLDALRDSAPWLALLVGVVAVACLHMVRLAKQGQVTRNEPDVRVLALALLFYLAISLLFAILTRHNWLPRHAIAAHPLVALLLPLLARPSIGRSSFMGQASLAALLVLNVISLGNHYFDRDHWKDDYRGTAAYLSQVGEPQRPVVLLRGIPRLLAYYGYDRFVPAPDPLRKDVRGIVNAAAAGRDEVVVVVNRENDLWPSGWLDQALSEDFRPLAQHRLPYFSIYTYARQ